MNLAEVLKKHDTTQVAVSRELGLGTTTIWRALVGTRIDAESARKLCGRFPELSFDALAFAPKAKPKPARRVKRKRVARAS